MSKIEWGSEIKIDGKRPEWLEYEPEWSRGGVDAPPLFIICKDGYRSQEDCGLDADFEWWSSKGGDRIVAIRLPADHPYYTKPELSGADDPAYSVLRGILDEAYHQAASGKGKERHANGNAWLNQPIFKIGRMVGVGFNTGQAIKKLQESSRMEPDAAVRELLGAIVYAASAIQLIRETAPLKNDETENAE